MADQADRDLAAARLALGDLPRSLGENDLAQVVDRRDVARLARLVLELDQASPPDEPDLVLGACGRMEQLLLLHVDSELRAILHHNLAVNYDHLGKPELGASHGESALAAWRTAVEAADSGRRSDLQANLAATAVNYAVTLGVLGRLDAAASVAAEAVAIYEDLDRGDYRQPTLDIDMATACTNLGLAYAAAGRAAEGVKPSEEAVRRLRRLASADPYVHEGELACALANHAIVLGAAGQPIEAVAPGEEAVAIHWRLSPHDQYVVEAGSALTNLASRYAAVGRNRDAARTASASVDHWRELGDDSAVVSAGLATALDVLAQVLTVLGDFDGGLSASEEAVGIWRALMRAGAGGHLPKLAAAINHLGAILSDLGRHEEALEAGFEAVALRTEQARLEPAASARGLAMSLLNLGVRLSAVGQHDQSLTTMEESVRQLRIVVERDGGAGEADLALALNNLGDQLSTVGRPEDACEVTAEAVERYRHLAEVLPSAHQPALAMALDNYGNRLADIGDSTAALDRSREAVELYRELTYGSHDELLTEYALALVSLSLRFSAIGELTEAAAVAEQALAPLRVAADRWPDRHLPDLALALNNLGGLYSESGRPAAALAPTLEALTVYERLDRVRPAVHRADLAMAVGNSALRFMEAGRWGDALDKARLSVDLHRELAIASPDVHRADLAMAASNLGVVLVEMGQIDEAVEPVLEAVSLYRELAHSRPRVFGSVLAATLANLGYVLWERDRNSESLAPLQEAVEFWRSLAADGASVHRAGLTGALHNLANQLAGLRRLEEALSPAEEEVVLLRDLTATDRQAYQADLALALDMLADLLANVERFEEALSAAEEAVEVYRELAREHGGRERGRLAMALNNLGVRRSEAGRDLAEAYEANLEATEILAALADEAPDVYRRDQALSLSNLGIRLDELGQHDDALDVSRRAVALLRPPEAGDEGGPPGRRPVELTSALYNLGLRLWRSGLWPDAVRCWLEGVADGGELGVISKMVQQVLDAPRSTWPPGGADDVESALFKLMDQLGAERFAVVSGRDRHRIQADLSWVASTGGVFLAVERERPDLAIMWWDATISLEDQLRSATRDSVIDQLRHAQPLLAARLEHSLRSAPGDFSTSAGASEDRELPSHVLAEIRCQSGFEDFLRPRQIDEIVADLRGRPTVLLSAGSGDGVAVLIDGDGVVTAERLALLLDDVVDLANEMIGAGDPPSSTSLVARFELGGLVDSQIRPVLRRIAAADPPPVVIPVGLLHWLPIGAELALSGQGVELGVRLDRERTERPAGRQPFVIHSDGPDQLPPLPEGLAEARELSELLRVDLLCDPLVSPIKVLDRLPRSSFGYISCHGSAGADDFRRNGLYLGSEILTYAALDEALASEGAPAIVVLSACRTALTDTTSPEQALSLSSLFLRHGTRSVLAAIWDVEEAVARQFGVSFVHRWLGGESAGEAYDASVVVVSQALRAAGRLASLDSVLAFTLYGDRSFRHR